MKRILGVAKILFDFLILFNQRTLRNQSRDHAIFSKIQKCTFSSLYSFEFALTQHYPAEDRSTLVKQPAFYVIIFVFRFVLHPHAFCNLHSAHATTCSLEEIFSKYLEKIVFFFSSLVNIFMS